MTPTNKVLLGGRGFALSHHPRENRAPGGFLLARPWQQPPRSFQRRQEMSNILVALDGSPASEKALDTAVKLAQKGGGQIAAVSVLDRSGDPRLERLAD